MPWRCAFGCLPNETAMHSFPNPDKYPDRFKVWVNLVGGNLENINWYKKKKICDVHFKDKDRNRFKRLNALAVPSLHLSGLRSTQTNLADNFNLPSIAQLTSTDESNQRRLEVASISDNATSSNATQDVEEIAYEDVTFLDDTLLDIDVAQSSKGEVHEAVFSWQKSVPKASCEQIVDDDVIIYEDVGKKQYDVRHGATDSGAGDDVTQQPLQSHFTCNICLKEISGLRYTCVQCLDWDLCDACEARGAHALHYVLRVPVAKTLKETQSILRAIRRVLGDSIENIDGEIKSEIKQEVKELVADDTLTAIAPEPLSECRVLSPGHSWNNSDDDTISEVSNDSSDSLTGEDDSADDDDDDNNSSSPPRSRKTGTRLQIRRDLQKYLKPQNKTLDPERNDEHKIAETERDTLQVSPKHESDARGSSTNIKKLIISIPVSNNRSTMEGPVVNLQRDQNLDRLSELKCTKYKYIGCTKLTQDKTVAVISDNRTKTNIKSEEKESEAKRQRLSYAPVIHGQVHSTGSLNKSKDKLVFVSTFEPVLVDKKPEQ